VISGLLTRDWALRAALGGVCFRRVGSLVGSRSSVRSRGEVGVASVPAPSPRSKAEEHFRLAAETLAVRLRWLSIGAIPILALASGEAVSWRWFGLLLASAVVYNGVVSYRVRAGQVGQVSSVGTAVLDSFYLAAGSFLSGGLHSPLTLYVYLAMVSVCTRLPLRWALVVAFLYCGHLAALDLLDGRGIERALAVRLGYLFLTIAFMAPLVANARSHLAEVLEGQQAQRRLLQRLLTLEEEERRRIAAELHDRGGGALFSLLHGLRRLRDLVEPRIAGATGEIDRLIRVVETLVRELRGFLADLRPRLLDDLGLSEALRDLLARERAISGLAISFDLEADGSPDPQCALALYRVAQEALTNVRRHAGARSVRVSLGRENGGWRLSIEDDGRGLLGAGPEGFGLRTMRERVGALGGELEIASGSGGGTRLVARIPSAGGASRSGGSESFGANDHDSRLPC
jgi:signal transduction histidine kinase